MHFARFFAAAVVLFAATSAAYADDPTVPDPGTAASPSDVLVPVFADRPMMEVIDEGFSLKTSASDSEKDGQYERSSTRTHEFDRRAYSLRGSAEHVLQADSLKIASNERMAMKNLRRGQEIGTRAYMPARPVVRVTTTPAPNCPRDRFCATYWPCGVGVMRWCNAAHTSFVDQFGRTWNWTGLVWLDP